MRQLMGLVERCAREAGFVKDARGIVREQAGVLQTARTWEEAAVLADIRLWRVRGTAAGNSVSKLVQADSHAEALQSVRGTMLVSSCALLTSIHGDRQAAIDAYEKGSLTAKPVLELEEERPLALKEFECCCVLLGDHMQTIRVEAIDGFHARQTIYETCEGLKWIDSVSEIGARFQEPRFKPGDKFDCINDYGVVWRDRHVTRVVHVPGKEPEYFCDPSDAHWVSGKESRMTLTQSAPEGVDPVVICFEAKVARELKNAESARVVFSTMLQEHCPENEVYHAHSGQTATVVAVVIRPDENWDEAALPAFRIRFEDGQEVEVFAEELFSKDHDFKKLYAAVVLGYAAARGLGEYASPYHLAVSGSDADKQKFLEALPALRPPINLEHESAPWAPMAFRRRSGEDFSPSI